MKIKRTKIPQKIADEVSYRSDMLCAVCRAPGDHIHHLDHESSNHNPDNLILLCFRHHNAATIKSSLSRKFSKGVLLRYRDQHYKQLEQRRALSPINTSSNKVMGVTEQALFQTTIDAMVCIEVEKIKNHFKALHWPLIQKHIYTLNMFPLGIGPRARKAILYALDDISSNTRHKMPLIIAQSIREIASNILPYRSFLVKNRQPMNKTEKEILSIGITIGFDIAYDAVKYLNNIKIADQGAQILWQVLSFVSSNKIKDVMKYASEEFLRAEETAKFVGDKYSAMLFNIYYKHALSGDRHFPQYPDELEEKLS